MAKPPPAEEQVRNFYEQAGWHSDEAGHSLDARLWEDLRECAQDYVSHCRRRIAHHLPNQGDFLLDAASGPIQYPEYLEFSKNFNKRYCVDISNDALRQAEEKLGTHGVYVNASLLDLPFKDNFFDASLSLHTVYHIAAEEQERAVRELIRVTKPNAPLIVIYANPERPTHLIKSLVKPHAPGPIYYHAHPLRWWDRFRDSCELAISPWRSLTATASRRLVPNNRLGKKMLHWLVDAEEAFPSIATSLGAYPLIQLTKR